MFFAQLRDIAKPQRFELIKALKRSVGMSVGELSEALGMSYMGVKQHCIELEKRGYVDTWRRPKEIGRPEKAYRLTDKANGLFPAVGAGFGLGILEAVAAAGGEAAAEKLLFSYFAEMGNAYSRRVTGDSVSKRAKSFARLRDAEGYLTRFLEDEDGACLVEHHNLHSEIFARYPNALRMEDAMVAKVVGVPVERSVRSASGLRETTFRMG